MSQNNHSIHLKVKICTDIYFHLVPIYRNRMSELSDMTIFSYTYPAPTERCHQAIAYYNDPKIDIHPGHGILINKFVCLLMC